MIKYLKKMFLFLTKGTNMKSEINNKIFGERLNSLMKEKNETIYTIGEYLHLSPATISRYRNGQMTPKMTAIQSLSSYFGVNVEWLLGESDERNKKIKNINLTEHEKSLIENYRKNLNMQSAINKLLELDN